jgi:hypothetical protein
MMRLVSQPKARTHIIQIREPKPGTLGNMNRSQIGGSRTVVWVQSITYRVPLSVPMSWSCSRRS